MNKQDIRNKIKVLRNNYDVNDLKTKSLKITNAFYKKYSCLNIFLLYYPIENEVNTIPLIDRLFVEGKEIYLPVVYDKYMIFKQFEGFDKLKAGKFGINEPAGKELDSLPDIMCIPGIAFDEKCNRIGYGGGYYDRYLAVENTIIKSAFAYEFQIIDKIKTENFDKAVDEIFTENCIIIRRV